jgi:hypothetical protein
VIPSLYVNAIEAIWITLNSLALLLTILALLDAWHDVRVAAGVDRRRARVVQARANVLPRIFVDGETPLTFGIVVVMLIPVVLLISSAFDMRDRNRLASLVLDDIASERAVMALESSVQENIGLTHSAIDRAHEAYKEANSVNVKIADLTAIVGDLTALLGRKEDKPAGQA